MKKNIHLFNRFVLFTLFYFFQISAAYSDPGDLFGLSVEELLNLEVTSVAKKAKSLNDSPAAIYVISQEDIKRIGATTVPEALRLAPGIDVARIDANKWAVSSRGFNGRFANKLLVLIDGRTAYTSTFAGVYWENQDVMLEDINRIEVIRGPGATLWGANAVNGVINIITKHSSDTQGGLLVAGGGTEEQGFGAFRYGGKLTTDTTARAYVKGFKRDESTFESSGEAGDDWDKVQGGFRMDSQLTRQDTLTVQGDAYHSNINQQQQVAQLSPPFQNTINESMETFGGNLLVRQQHTFSSTSDYSLQLFYDFYERNEGLFIESRHTADIDFQHRFAFLEWNDIVWGLGYRYSHDDWANGSVFSINPPSRNDQLFSGFVQDEITLLEDTLWLTIGSKFEHNNYSGFEAQPTARLMWAPHHQHRLWTAVSRAVRTPSRAGHDIRLLVAVTPAPAPLPAFALTINGSDKFDSEELISYEIGYRTTFIKNVSIDFTAFYNDYDNLRSVQSDAAIFKGTYIEQPLVFRNNNAVHSYGFEIATVWQMLDWWRWDAHYSLLKTEFDGQGSTEQTSVSPQQRVSIRSAMSPLKNIDVDILFRYVDQNTTTGIARRVINDYVSMDIRLGWRPINNLELSLVGQNLLAEQHLEYINEAFPTPIEIDRGIYGKLVWQF